MFDMRRREPDTADPGPSSMTAVSTSSEAARASTYPMPSTSKPCFSGTNAAAAEEEGEEESATNGEMEVDTTRTTAVSLENLLTHLRNQQNECLAKKRFEDEAELQVSQMSVLEATQQGIDLTVELLRHVQNGYKCLCRRARNRGDGWYAQHYKGYSENLLELMG